jgi:hypothetical protein
MHTEIEVLQGETNDMGEGIMTMTGITISEGITPREGMKDMHPLEACR